MSVGKKISLLASGVYALVVIACISFGSAIGVGTYTFYYAQGASYFSDSSKSCVNCHIMRDHYAAWMKSSHHNVAQCNDCHSPPGKLTEKLFCKGLNGFNHSAAFTLGLHQDQLMITDFNRNITWRCPLVWSVLYVSPTRVGSGLCSCLMEVGVANRSRA